jgi:hypothetical protein
LTPDSHGTLVQRRSLDILIQRLVAVSLTDEQEARAGLEVSARGHRG